MMNVVSYRNSTSNHNIRGDWAVRLPVVSYRNSTSNHNSYLMLPGTPGVVSYRNSTSNHNNVARIFSIVSLYLIEILHQTTTYKLLMYLQNRCILSKFYIKPQLCTITISISRCCILSKFYIKPQPSGQCFTGRRVVSYRNSTSNHNL